ncbi:MAG: hypothetical protein ABSH22_10370, partial [Tepidisphaeraceae bacterium]
MVTRRATLTGFALLLAVLMAAAGAKAILYDTLDPDLFWRLRVADQLHDQSFPAPIIDHLSFASSKEPWTPYSWLADLAIKRLWDFGGYRTAIAAEALMTADLVLFIGLTALEISITHHGRPRYLAAALAAFTGEFLSLAYLSFRPVTFALVLLAAIAWLLQRDQRLGGRSRAVWWIIPLTALLANVHLYVVFAPLAVAAVFLGEICRSAAYGSGTNVKRWAVPTRRDSILLAATSLASLATPMLPGALAAAWHYQFHDPMVSGNTIAEMQPFYRGQLGSISAILVAIVILAALINRRRLTAGNWLLLGISLLALLRLGRFAPIFAIFAVPTLAATLPQLSDV